MNEHGQDTRDSGEPERAARLRRLFGPDTTEAGGLYDFHCRALNPAVGRWMPRDPAGYVDGATDHAYPGGAD
jgi:hypothetical protein